MSDGMDDCTCQTETTRRLNPGIHGPACPVSRRVADVGCPAWADGKHLFVEYYRNCEGFTSRAWQPEGKFTARESKRCACGAEVARTK